MLKKHQQQNQPQPEPVLSVQELYAFDKEIENAGGWEQYLISRDVIRMKDYHGIPKMVVVQKPDGTIEYPRMQRKHQQLQDWKARKAYAERKEIENLTGQKVVDPQLLEAKEKLLQTVGLINKHENTESQ